MSKPVEIEVNREVTEKLKKWERTQILLNDDEGEITDNFCLQMYNEHSKAFESRKAHFSNDFLNPVWDLIMTPIRAVCQNEIKYTIQEGSMVEAFLNNVVGGVPETSMEKFARNYIAVMLRAFGNATIVVDKPNVTFPNKLSEMQYGLPYLSVIHPMNIINWQKDQDGFIWFAYNIPYYSTGVWVDPLNKPKVIENVTAVWTREQFFLIYDNQVKEVRENNFGFVPIVHEATYLQTPYRTIGDCSLNTSGRLLITMNTIGHTAAQELRRHSASILLMHEDSVTSSNTQTDIEGNALLKKQDTGGVLTYAGGTPPAYLIKDLQLNYNKEWLEIYKEEIYRNERDQLSVNKPGSGQQVAESGFAKLIGREPIKNNLYSLAVAIEDTIRQVIDMVSVILGEDPEKTSMEYDKTFDVQTTKQKYDEMAMAISNGIREVSPTAYKKMWTSVLTPEMDNEEEMAVVQKEIDEYEFDVLNTEEVAEDETE